MNRDHVVARVEDWIKRLDAFYRQIDSWYELLPPTSERHLYVGSILQRDEPLMRQFDVQPRMIETRSIIYGKNRISFVPSVLWIIGANGRINVSTHDTHFVIVDMGGMSDQPSSWEIVTSQLRHVHRSFDAGVFNNLVQFQAIEAA